MKVINNNVKNTKTADYDTFLTWNFNNLKDAKRDVSNLKNAIKKHGFDFPVFTWTNPENNQVYVIDGAGRKKALEELTFEDYRIQNIPYVEIEAGTIEEAKQKTLNVSSSFGFVTKESLIQFADGMEIDFSTFAIDGINENSLKEDNFNFKNKEVKFTAQDEETHAKKCPNCGYEIQD